MVTPVLLGGVYAAGYLRPYFDTPRHLGLHYALLNLTSLSFVLVCSGDHALVFLLGWEIAALAAQLLVIWDYTNQTVRFAGFNCLSGGIFGESYASCGRVANVIPVDATAPGCPPAPIDLLRSVLGAVRQRRDKLPAR